MKPPIKPDRTFASGAKFGEELKRAVGQIQVPNEEILFDLPAGKKLYVKDRKSKGAESKKPFKLDLNQVSGGVTINGVKEEFGKVDISAELLETFFKAKGIATGDAAGKIACLREIQEELLAEMGEEAGAPDLEQSLGPIPQELQRRTLKHESDISRTAYLAAKKVAARYGVRKRAGETFSDAAVAYAKRCTALASAYERQRKKEASVTPTKRSAAPDPK